VEEEATSRKRCSTPISSASSASMDVGTCVNVRWVAVPSCDCQFTRVEKEQWALPLSAPGYRVVLSSLNSTDCKQNGVMTYITDLFHRKVRIRRDPRLAPPARAPRIHNHHHRALAEPAKELCDFQVGRSESGARVVEAYWPFLCCSSAAA
jgi:hypothetical protein